MSQRFPVYVRRRQLTWLDRASAFRVRFAMRASAVLFLGLVVATGLVRGEYLNYEGSKWLKLPGKAAGLVGMAAEDISITGLEHHEPQQLLAAIGVDPGGSLIGFDAGHARRILEGLDWVEAAKVQRLFPNQLAIEIREREPFAIWQRGNSYYVIDRSGSAMSGLAASELVRLPLVTGEGANTAAAELVNQLSAHPDIVLQVKAAARVGKRRWTLYLDSGITVQLPEKGWQEALAMADELNRTQRLLSRGIRSVDLRLSGRVIVEVAELEAAAPEDGTKKAAAGTN